MKMKISAVATAMTLAVGDATDLRGAAGGKPNDILVGGAEYFEQQYHEATRKLQTKDPNSLQNNALIPRGHLFGTGYNQYATLQIDKSLEQVKDICYRKCYSEEKCSGFHWRINARYDGRPNGDCWFMTGDPSFVDGPAVASFGGGVWIKENNRSSPVCGEAWGDVSFNPDPLKYYTIATEGGLVWAQGNPGTSGLNWMSKQNTPGMRMYLSTDKVSSASHWRFVRDSGDKWIIQNRLTGLQVKYDNDFRLTTDLSTTIQLKATCSSPAAKDKVFLEMEGVAGGAFPRCDIGGCIFGSKVNMIERKRHETKSTGCVWGGCGSGWTQTDSTSYFFCTDYACERYVSVPGQKEQQWWSIIEAKEFIKPDVAQPVTVTVQEHALETLGNELAFAGDVLLKDTPILGALFGFARSEFLSGPTVAQQLQTLADEMQKMSSDMISTGISNHAIDEANKRLAARRFYFLVEYPGHKHQYIVDGDISQLDDLADDLLDKASEYAVDITTYFGTDNSPTNLNVKRARKGFQYLKFAMVEALTIYQEGVLLQAYAHPKYTCESLVSRHLVPGGFSRAERYNAQLHDTWTMLKDHRLSTIGASQNQQMYTCEAHDDFNDSRTELFYFSGGGAANVYPTAQQVKEAARDALTHDMQYWSYPTQAQTKYFDGYEDRTLAMCEALRTDPAFKSRFGSDNE